MITRIAIDLDDVLADFTLATLSHKLNRKVVAADYDPEWGFDIVRAYNTLQVPGVEKETVQSFWESIGRDDWENLERLPDSAWLIQRCAELVGNENVCILTAPTEDPECMAGKLEWIQSNMPRWIRRNFLVGPMKHFCAKGDTLLIDDSSKNVDMFRRWGGSAMLVPKPWNSAHADFRSIQQIFRDDLR